MTHPDRLPQYNPHDAPASGPELRVPELRVVVLPHGEGLDLPAYETPGSAGMDLRAAVEDGAPMEIAPGGRFAVPTGLIMEIPEGYEAQVRPRSGLALKFGVTCLNSPGTIDSDYRGEVKVILVNLGAEPFVVTRGMRVAQLVIAPVVQVRLTVGAALSETGRAAGGFGSTGVT